LNTLYIHEENVHNLTAPREVIPIIMSITTPKSVLDVGCGIGTWLKVFEEHGIKDYLGVDGNYVDFKKLKIPQEKFHTQDLREYWSLNRKFDLAISLEVAEHLPAANADQFVKILVEHSDSIIFSAAIPGQSGQNHLNEQWPEYWETKFAKHGFYFYDIIRPEIWTNNKVEWWYKQNMFLVQRTKPRSLPFNSLSVVHPQLFSLQKQNEQDFYQSLSQGRQGVKLASKIFINALAFKIQNFFTTKKV
jgi:SAM-dependent methyltransferase